MERLTTRQRSISSPQLTTNWAALLEASSDSNFTEFSTKSGTLTESQEKVVNNTPLNNGRKLSPQNSQWLRVKHFHNLSLVTTTGLARLPPIPPIPSDTTAFNPSSNQQTDSSKVSMSHSDPPSKPSEIPKANDPNCKQIPYLSPPPSEPPPPLPSNIRTPTVEALSKSDRRIRHRSSSSPALARYLESMEMSDINDSPSSDKKNKKISGGLKKPSLKKRDTKKRNKLTTDKTDEKKTPVGIRASILPVSRKKNETPSKLPKRLKKVEKPSTTTIKKKPAPPTNPSEFLSEKKYSLPKLPFIKSSFKKVPTNNVTHNQNNNNNFSASQNSTIIPPTIKKSELSHNDEYIFNGILQELDLLMQYEELDNIQELFHISEDINQFLSLQYL